jgi:type III secretory pathway lipoprotein EscJ
MGSCCRVSRILLVFGLLLAISCGGQSEILANLSSQQSLEAVVSLAKGGVSAKRLKTSTGRKELYRVVVPSKDEAKALTILHEYGLPRATEESLEQFTRPQGFAPNTPQMEDLRLDYALGLRLEHLLGNLPGVVGASVLVRANLTSSQYAHTDRVAPGASLVLRFVSNSDALPFSLEEVKNIVQQAVPGITHDAITIRTTQVFLPESSSLFADAANPAGGSAEKLAQLRPFVFRVPESEIERASVQIVFILLAVCAAGGVLGWVWGANAVKKRVRQRKPTNGGDKSFFLEATIGDADQKGAPKPLTGPSQSRLQPPTSGRPPRRG